jgi:hypothetical protein
VTAHASHFDRRDAVQAVAELLPNGGPAHEVEATADAFLASDSVVGVSESAKGERFTTKRIWELEREALETAERMKAEPSGEAGELIAARVIGSRPTLKADQREMVGRLLAGREGIVVVIGEAGTGKSFATVAAAEGWAQAGYELRVAAPTWRAANVLRAEGLEATTVASLLQRLERAEANGRSGLRERTVLMVDEAGMVGSENMASLIRHAEAAEAKLVLIGDPEQLGAIEAGGLFSAIAARGDPVVLDEVIRHEHELDRDAAKHIREGEGREALSLYCSAERVTVAPSAEERREVMVEDWWQSFREGEDALMVAKRNVEVARLNATARELMRSEGRLGAEEVEVGEARFAAGDQVITRINDRANDIYNRERWTVAEVDAERRSLALDGVDQARRVEVGPDYLAQTTLGGDAPALQHAYAVTTYCAQGTTVDSAYVMADPSMDKQELYVATSRSRGETRLYATPEIQAERDEYAPKPPERDAITHIDEAAERDRAQTAAHDEALRAEMARLPLKELDDRRFRLQREANFEAQAEHAYNAQVREVQARRKQYERAVAECEEVEALGWRQRRQKLPRALEREELHRERLRENVEELAGMQEPGTELRREHEIATQTLAKREAQMLTALGLKPPPYILKELGERPSDRFKAQSWDRGALRIEDYRHRHGIRDQKSALGREPSDPSERASRRAAEETLRRIQRDLGLKRGLGRSSERGIGIERSLGIGL